jgi:eukaryotic translation initiation factor 2C
VRSTTKSSCASPAYYADQLCERGRCYLQSFFSPDKRTTKYEAFEKWKEGIEEQYKQKMDKELAALPVEPTPDGTSRPRKSPEQMRIEQKYRRKIAKSIADEGNSEAVDAWNERCVDGTNPWHPNLNDCMFWM